MTYKLILDNGHVHEGSDERDIEALLDAISRHDGDDLLPTGWAWAAELYFKVGHVVAVYPVPVA